MCTRKICVQQVSVCTPSVRTHNCCFYVGANPCEYDPTTKNWNNKKLMLSTDRKMCEWMLLGFPTHALLLILDDAFVWNFESEFLVHRELSFPIVWERLYNLRVVFLDSAHLPIVFFGLSCRRLQWVCLNFVLCNSQLLASWIFFAAFSLRLLSLYDSFACTSRPCNSLFDQLRLSDVIRSKSYTCNFDLGSSRIALNVEFTRLQMFLNVTSLFCRGTSCLAFFQHRLVHNVA